MQPRHNETSPSFWKSSTCLCCRPLDADLNTLTNTQTQRTAASDRTTIVCDCRTFGTLQPRRDRSGPGCTSAGAVKMQLALAQWQPVSLAWRAPAASLGSEDAPCIVTAMLTRHGCTTDGAWFLSKDRLTCENPHPCLMVVVCEHHSVRRHVYNPCLRSAGTYIETEQRCCCASGGAMCVCVRACPLLE